jgi:hypothetical protein
MARGSTAFPRCRAIDASELKRLCRAMVFAAAQQQKNQQRPSAAVLAHGHREEP